MTLLHIARAALLAAMTVGKALAVDYSPNFQLLDRSVVNVEVICPFQPDSTGLDECSGRATGIVLSERDGIVRVLTARHEVHGVNADPNAKITLTFAFDQLKPMPAKLLFISNEQLDLAILEAELPKGAAGFGTLPLNWEPHSTVKKGMPLWAVDGTWQALQGNAVEIVQDHDGQRLRYTCDAANGYSGGPVFDAAGDLVAVHLRSDPEIAANLRDGVTIEAVVEWLTSLGYSAESINRLVTSSPASVGNVSKTADTAKLRPLSDGDRGTLLFRAGRYPESLPLLADAAKKGDGHAATILGGMYVAGQGVAHDLRAANSWWSLGAQAGEPAAMSPLAADYVAGAGIQQDFVKGAYWYRRAADLNDPTAMTGLALMFANGQINADGNSARVPHRQAYDTDVQAAYWYRRASQAGDLLGRACLGIMYANGRGGLARSDEQAVRLYRSAADRGSADGMQLLGDMYLAGRVDHTRNFNQAVFWYRRAAALGDRLSRERLAKIAEANPNQRF